MRHVASINKTHGGHAQKCYIGTLDREHYGSSVIMPLQGGYRNGVRPTLNVAESRGTHRIAIQPNILHGGGGFVEKNVCLSPVIYGEAIGYLYSLTIGPSRETPI